MLSIFVGNKTRNDMRTLHNLSQAINETIYITIMWDSKTTYNEDGTLSIQFDCELDALKYESIYMDLWKKEYFN